MKKIFFLVLFIFFPLIVSAKEVKFFEFSPDTADAINFPSTSALYQYFKPYNDFISGLDIWIDNNQNNESISVSLYDSNNNLLASKTINVSQAPKIWGGNKLHIDFNKAINISSTKTYKIKMLSSSNSLRVYYKNKTELMEHNSEINLDPRIGPAYLDSFEQPFYFKFALYENNDNLPPVISNFSLASSSQNSVIINFNANEPVDYKANFIALNNSNENKSTNFKNNYELCPLPEINTCHLSINLLPDMNYKFDIFIKDEWDNQTQISGLFDGFQTTILNFNNNSTTTSSEEIYQNPDLIAPIISNQRIVNINFNSVKIAWSTDKAARSRLIISRDEKGNDIIADVYDNAYELEHTLDSGTGLSPNTDYFAILTAYNIFGNFSFKILNFKTLNQPDQLSPSLEESSQTSKTSTSQSQEILNKNFSSSNNILEINSKALKDNEYLINISWQKKYNPPTDGYRIDIFDSHYRFIKKILVPPNENNATLTLASGNYKIVVYANNNDVFEKITKPTEIEIPQNLSQEKQFSLFQIYLIIGLLIAFIGLIIFYLFYKHSLKLKNKKLKSEGFTILEIIIGVAILIAIGGLISLFAFRLSEYQLIFSGKFKAQQEIQQTIPFLINELRSASDSNTGGYPIALAKADALTFYSDLDNDNLIEQIRYFKENNILKKGIIKPKGNPLTYDPNDEVVTEEIHNLLSTSTPIFSYYDENYTSNETAMSEPIDISKIRIIEVFLAIQDQSNKTPVIFKIKVTPRNLRSNL